MSGRKSGRQMDGQLWNGAEAVQASFAIGDEQAAKSEAVLVLVDMSSSRRRTIVLPTSAGELGLFAVRILERLAAIGAPVPAADDLEVLGEWCELEGATDEDPPRGAA